MYSKGDLSIIIKSADIWLLFDTFVALSIFVQAQGRSFVGMVSLSTWMSRSRM